MNDRTKQLLTAMAEAHCSLNFIDGDFLCNHDIRSDELDIFEMAGQILKGFLLLKQSEQTRIQLLGSGMDPRMAQTMFESLRRGELKEEMNAIRL